MSPLSSSTSVNCDCYECQYDSSAAYFKYNFKDYEYKDYKYKDYDYKDYTSKNVRTPFYPTMGHPLVYYAQVEHLPKSQLANEKPNADMAASVGFADWLDSKYEQFLQEQQTGLLHPVKLTQTSLIETDNLLKCARKMERTRRILPMRLLQSHVMSGEEAIDRAPAGISELQIEYLFNHGSYNTTEYKSPRSTRLMRWPPFSAFLKHCFPCNMVSLRNLMSDLCQCPPGPKKVYAKIKSTWRKRPCCPNPTEEQIVLDKSNNRSLVYLLEPKELPRPVSDCCQPTSTSCCSDSCKKTVIKSQSETAVNLEKKSEPPIDIVPNQEGAEIREKPPTNVTKKKSSIGTPKEPSKDTMKSKSSKEKANRPKSPKSDVECQCTPESVLQGEAQTQYETVSQTSKSKGSFTSLKTIDVPSKPTDSKEPKVEYFAPGKEPIVIAEQKEPEPTPKAKYIDLGDTKKDVTCKTLEVWIPNVCLKSRDVATSCHNCPCQSCYRSEQIVEEPLQTCPTQTILKCPSKRYSLAKTAHPRKMSRESSNKSCYFSNNESCQQCYEPPKTDDHKQFCLNCDCAKQGQTCGSTCGKEAPPPSPPQAATCCQQPVIREPRLSKCSISCSTRPQPCNSCSPRTPCSEMKAQSCSCSTYLINNDAQTSDHSINLDCAKINGYPLFMKIVCADKPNEDCICKRSIQVSN